MSLGVRIHEAAEAEIKEAADFYDIESPGLGDEFTDDIDRIIERIANHPQAAPISRDSLRSIVLTRFPYTLVYHIGESEITVLAAAHHRRRPFYWTSRV